jgi:hypothetical protein
MLHCRVLLLHLLLRRQCLSPGSYSGSVFVSHKLLVRFKEFIFQAKIIRKPPLPRTG